MIRMLTVTAIAFFTATTAWSADAPTAAPLSGAKPPSVPVADQTPPKPFVYAPKNTDVVTGKGDVPVTIVEYASLSCPHCSHFFLHVLPDITAKYIDAGKAKLVYRDFPLNDPALKAAELVQCADPSQRHAFVKVLFSTQMKWAYDSSYREALSNIAVLGGIDRLKFESCMNNKSIEKAILNVAKEASDDYHINSTPTFYINGTEYKGDRDTASMSKVIDAELAKAVKK